jgi:hypothetical protein
LTIKEAFEVKTMWMRIWSRKWLITATALALFLSVGAVAWAAAGDGTQASDPSVGSQVVAGGAVLALAGADEQLLTAAKTPDPQAKEALKAKREQRIKRIEALMKLVRDTMSPADQAAYDQLVQTAKDQRTALQQARVDLNQTVKDLRELTNKYVDVGSPASGSAPAATTTQ